MAKYTIRFNYHTYVEITVKASNTAEALEKAEDELVDSKYNGDLLENIERDGDPKVINEEIGMRDVKEGDVVVDKSNETIGIFQSIGHHPNGGSYNDPSYCFLYCRYSDGFFYADFEQGNTIASDDLALATKEQHDFFFQKMEEAGYEWDAEKKELRQCNQKSTVDYPPTEQSSEEFNVDNIEPPSFEESQGEFNLYDKQ